MIGRVLGLLGALLLALGVSFLGERSSVTLQAQGTGRTAICHVDGGSRSRLLGVSQSAVAAHMEHGDHAVLTFYRDADGDGLGDPAQPARACSAPEGFVADATDCDDTQVGGCDVITEFVWEVSTDGGSTWNVVALPDTNWGCTFCTRLYRTFVDGTPSDVSFQFGSDNEARMLVNGVVAFDEYFITGVDWCTAAACCSQCCDTPGNCTGVVLGQAPFSLDTGDLLLFGPGTNEIRWEVNQQSGGSGFHTLMAVTQ